MSQTPEPARRPSRRAAQEARQRIQASLVSTSKSSAKNLSRKRQANAELNAVATTELKRTRTLVADPVSSPFVKPLDKPSKKRKLTGTCATKKTLGSARGPSRDLEAELWAAGFSRVAGVDEAGRGPLAGPVVAAACILPIEVELPGLNDSKQLTGPQREQLYEAIVNNPQMTGLWAVSIVERDVIDDINILQATLLGMKTAVEGVPANYVVVDGNKVPAGLLVPARSVVKGDTTCLAIAAASVLAKVTRDRIMVKYEEQYPGYGFAQHKGYGTAAHMAAVKKQGPCAIHRRSFEPIKSMVDSTST